jgi:ABC-2 type transport system permease protein
MKAVIAIFKREFYGYFRTPIAYVFLALFIIANVALTWYVGKFFERSTASLDIFFMFFPWAYLFFIPAVGMRLWAEEKRLNTWELLFTMPVTILQAVVAKFLAGWAFLTIAILLTFTMPVTLYFLGTPEWGPIIGGYFGSILMAGSFLSICSLTSSITKNQIISFVISVIICLILVLIGWSVFNSHLHNIFPVWIVDALANFSFITHFDAMLKGLITLKDILFFISVMIFSLCINVLVLER